MRLAVRHERCCDWHRANKRNVEALIGGSASVELLRVRRAVVRTACRRLWCCGAPWLVFRWITTVSADGCEIVRAVPGDACLRRVLHGLEFLITLDKRKHTEIFLLVSNGKEGLWGGSAL